MRYDDMHVGDTFLGNDYTPYDVQPVGYISICVAKSDERYSVVVLDLAGYNRERITLFSGETRPHDGLIYEHGHITMVR